jgi:hypothetical protein
MEPHDLKVYWGVGHGITAEGVFDSGAKGGGQTEQSAGDIVAKSGADTMRSWGVWVRDECYQDDPNYSRTDNLVRSWGADILVEVHHDWIGAEPGFFALWYKSPGHALGNAIEAAVARAGFYVRDYPADGYRANLSLLKNVGNIPAVLVECGRIGQYTPDQLKRLGVAIAQGVADYAKIDTEEDDMFTDQDREKLNALDAQVDRLRVTSVAQSWNFLIEEARDAGDEAEVARLKAKKTAAVAEVREALGL